jgi:transposase
MRKSDDLSRSLVPFDPETTLIVVVEMSLKAWLIAGIVPGVEREPLKKLGANEEALAALIARWRGEAERSGRKIGRIVVSFEAGRDGFWLARWLEARGHEVHVLHPNSVAVSQEHRRAKTDRLDTDLLKRTVLGWLRGERGHCRMVAVPTSEEEDAKRPNREHESLVGERTRIINRIKGSLVRLGVRGFNPKLKAAAQRLGELRTPEGRPIPENSLAELKRDMDRLRLIREQVLQIEKMRAEKIAERPAAKPNLLVQLLTRVVGLGVETADMLVHEVMLRSVRDRRALARYAGLTGSPHESGSMRREKGMSRSGNPRVRRGMVEFAWRFLRYQPTSDLACWYHQRTGMQRNARKPMIIALARKLLIALWRMTLTGEAPQGWTLRPAN